MMDIDAVVKRILGNSTTVSIIGNGRGSGKTTALKSFLKYNDSAFGISSFGNDRIENIESGLVHVKEGTICATCHGSLAFSDITKEILATTGINTPLGQIVILRAKSQGHVVLSGASTVEESIVIRDMLKDFGAERVIFDGSLNRKSPASPRLSDSVTLTFSASPRLRAEMDYLMEIFSLRQFPTEYLPKGNFILINDEYIQGQDIKTNLSKYLGDNSVRMIGIRGAIQKGFVHMLTHLSVGQTIKGASLIIDDATKLFIDQNEYRMLVNLGIEIYVRQGIRVNSIFVNPYNTGYSEGEMSEVLGDANYGIPILDIVGGACYGGV